MSSYVQLTVGTSSLSMGPFEWRACAIVVVRSQPSSSRLVTYPFTLFPCNPVVLFAPRRIIHIPAGPSSRPACAPRSDWDQVQDGVKCQKSRRRSSAVASEMFFFYISLKSDVRLAASHFCKIKQRQCASLNISTWFSLEFVKTKLTLNFFSDWHVNTAAPHPPLSSRFAAITGRLGSFLLH